MNRYTISKAGIAFIKNEEGCKLRAYKDQVGVWTIGYGHTGPDVTPGLQITAERAEQLLVQDLGKCEKAIQTKITRVLSTNQVDSLCSFAFNVGVSAFEDSTLLKTINVDPVSPEVRRQFMRWTKGTINGKKVDLPVLIARRKREANLYFS
jgi:lysozyme